MVHHSWADYFFGRPSPTKGRYVHRSCSGISWRRYHWTSRSSLARSIAAVYLPESGGYSLARLSSSLAAPWTASTWLFLIPGIGPNKRQSCPVSKGRGDRGSPSLLDG